MGTYLRLSLLLLGIALLTWGCGGVSSQGILWERDFAAIRPYSLDLVVGEAGDMYMVGRISRGGAFLRKYDSDGNEAWAVPYGTHHNLLTATRPDGVGGVYAVGDMKGPHLIQYGSDGRELWARPLRGGVYALTTPEVATNYIDEEGNLYAAAALDGVFLTKYANDGDEHWTRHFGTGAGVITALEVDATGNITLAGGLSGIGAYLLKYGVDGNILWTREFDPETPAPPYLVGRVKDLAVTQAGDMYLMRERALSDIDKFMAKYDVDGNELWARQKPQEEDVFTFDNTKYLAVDRVGNQFVLSRRAAAGDMTGLVIEWDTRVTKYDADGKELWARELDNTFGATIHLGISDETGNLYVVRTNLEAVSVLKYDVDGNETWKGNFRVGGAENRIVAIVLNGSRDLYVAGSKTLKGEDSPSRAFVAKVAHLP